jgi:uncharacterized protein (UPF0335 family)
MDVGGIASEQLHAFVARIERLEEEKADIADSIKAVYAEAKASGFATGIIREIVALRKQSEEERAEHDALLDLYKRALGMLADTPLGEAAVAKAAAETQRRSRRNGSGARAH